MDNRFFVVGLLAIISFSTSAQTGNYFISHYSPTDERIDFRSHDMAQDNHGELYFANKAGVLEFDGFDWNVISVPGAVYTLATNGTEVLIGGLTGVGKLNEKIQTPRSYDVISQASGFFSSAYYDNKTYVCSDKLLIVYALDSHLVESTIAMTDSTGNFQGIFQLGNDIVVSTKKSGLHKVQGNTLVPFEFPFSNIMFSMPSPSTKSFLIGTKDNRIFILNDGQVNEVLLQQSTFLPHHILSDGVWASEHVLALGTKRGGVIFVNVLTGATEGIVDYANGLPDNEVFSVMKDRNAGVWVAHEYGFSRIAINMPFRSFHHYPGLQGNLLCVQSYQNTIYVGTTLGLFTLVPASQQSAEKKQNRPDKGIATNASMSSNTLEQAYEYKKVNRVEGKVIQLAELNGNFIAYGAGGLYEVKGQDATLIMDEPIRHVYRSTALNQVLVSTTSDQIRTFIPENGWKETHLLDTLVNHFSYVFEDKLNNVWLCGSTYIYKVEAVDGEIIEILKYPVENPTEDETLGLALGSEVYVVSSGQFKHFDGKGFVKYDSLSGGHRYFASAGSFWFNDGKKWRTVDRKIQSMKLEWLGIFPNLRFLSPDNKSLWAITDKNELYKFYNEQSDSSEALYPLFLREVRGNQVKLKDQLEIDQSEGAFTFKFIRPDYIGAHATQYRYMVKGLNAQWSSWSASNNIIPFSYLPAGVYQLAIQSKNALGAETLIEEVAFEVLPPYWKRWWFFALEFFFFSFLVSLSIQLARSNSRYRYLSQVLTILTVIMLIQFIQTAIDSLIDIRSSPVIDFFIQVSIALLVLPVEIVARNAMQKVVQNKISVQRLFNNPEDL